MLILFGRRCKPIVCLQNYQRSTVWAAVIWTRDRQLSTGREQLKVCLRIKTFRALRLGRYWGIRTSSQTLRRVTCIMERISVKALRIIHITSRWSQPKRSVNPWSRKKVYTVYLKLATVPIGHPSPATSKVPNHRGMAASKTEQTPRSAVRQTDQAPKYPTTQAIPYSMQARRLSQTPISCRSLGKVPVKIMSSWYLPSTTRFSHH